MLFYIRANVSLKVDGISGPFIRPISWLVNADNHILAKQKFENQVKKDFAHMQFRSAEFEYTEIAGEIL